MKKPLRYLLSLNSLQKSLGYTTFFSATKFDHHVQIINNINAKKALILAPHPDDDVFGLGGTIRKISHYGTVVTVAYLCDGAGGVPEGRNEEGEVKRIDRDLINIRKDEAKKSGDILGVSEQIFFGHRDGKLASGSAVNKALDELINRIKPDIIFVPSFLDNHPDHRATNEVLINLISQNANIKQVEIWAYEVWTPLFPNRIVNISFEIKNKKEAMEAHKSQLKSRRYDEAILGLNKYRAEINNCDGYAEAFFATTAEIYQQLYRKS